MRLGTYWVGQIPSAPLRISIYGRLMEPAVLENYDEVSLRMLGSDNEEIDLSGGNIRLTNTPGTLEYEWPTNKSLFKKAGDYLVQAVLVTPESRDYTTPHGLVVKKFGRGRL